MSDKLWIFAPCFYDSDSLSELRKRLTIVIDTSFKDWETRLVIVDDSAGQDSKLSQQDYGSDIIVRSPYQLGHQGALVFALRSMAAEISDLDYVVTMDCDGEDRPEDLRALIEPLLNSASELGSVAVGRRTKRNEGIKFRIMLFIFQRVFALLTGLVVHSGNFAAYRGWFVRHALLHPYFDYCYSSSILAITRQYHCVPLPRGQRYFGTSKMTFLDLAAHGLTMLLPFADRIAFRTFFLCFTFVLMWVAVTVSLLVATFDSAIFAKLFVVASFLLGSALLLVVVGTMFLLIASRVRLLKAREWIGDKVSRVD